MCQCSSSRVGRARSLCFGKGKEILPLHKKHGISTYDTTAKRTMLPGRFITITAIFSNMFIKITMFAEILDSSSPKLLLITSNVHGDRLREVCKIPNSSWLRINLYSKTQNLQGDHFDSACNSPMWETIASSSLFYCESLMVRVAYIFHARCFMQYRVRFYLGQVWSWLSNK